MRFSELTAVRRTATDEFTHELDPTGWIIRGPNGGYLAAVILRALVERIGDRPPRSLTIHYLAVPNAGPATIHTDVVREGRSLVSATARLEQDGRPTALALAAFSPAWAGPSWGELAPPPTVDFAQAPHLDRGHELPFTDYWDQRLTIGANPFGGGDRAEVGGWIRLVEPEPVDAIQLAAMADAWPPALFSRIESPAAAPTIDLTIHFRIALPYAGMAADDPVLCRFTSATSTEGFFEEDGALWAPDGTLLVQSRQLAIVMPG